MTPVNGITVDATNAGVALMWLDREDHGNAFTSEMQDELHLRLAELDADEAVRAIVITGRGRLFCSGADISSGGSAFAMDDAAVEQLRDHIARRPRPWRMRTPVIAAMNGSAVGLGLTFPLQWDLRVMAQDAKYGFVFPRRGLIPEANSLWILPRLVGVSRATELLLTGRLFSGDEAADMGLASWSVQREEVLPRALEIATDLAAQCAPLAVGLTKQLLYELLEQPDREDAYAREWDLFRWIGNQPDIAEGVAAFQEKRDPVWPTPKSAVAPQSTDRWGPPR